MIRYMNFACLGKYLTFTLTDKCYRILSFSLSSQ